MSRCNFTHIPCGFCGKEVPKAHLEDHASQCDQRLERCKDCGDSIKFAALKVSSDSIFQLYLDASYILIAML